MKAGIFPLNPANINRSRLLQIEQRPASDNAIVDASGRTTANETPATINVAPLLTSSPNVNNINLRDSVQQPSSSSFPTFHTSQEAISALDSLFEDNVATFDDDDEDYIPNFAVREPADSAPSLKVRQHRSTKKTDNLSCQPPAPRRSRRKFPVLSEIIGLESSDDEG